MRQLRFGGVELPVVEQDLRRFVPDLRVFRVELHEAAVADHRLLVAPERAVRVGHVDDDEIVVGFQLQGALVLRDGVPVIVPPVILVSKHEPGVDDLRILRDDAFERVQRFLRFAIVARGLARRGHQVEQLDLVLRVGEARAIARSRRDERADVAERREPLARIRIDFNVRFRRRRRRRHPAFERAQLLLHPIAERGPFRIDVLRFRWILLQIVQFRTRRRDVLVAPGGERAEIAPSEMESRVNRFGIRAEAELLPGPGHQRHDARALELFPGLDAEQVQRRRQDVDAPHRVGHAPTRHRVERRTNQERHVQGRLIHEEAVRAFAMLAEALAVIAHHDDHGVPREVVRVEVREQAAHLRIDEGDLADVRVTRIARRERLRRLVR